jgi:hypothetical protein
MEDDTLERMARRIRARAIRRTGELLKQYDARPTNYKRQTVGTDSLPSQREAAEQAGLSKDQQVQAVRPATSLERPPHPLND